MKNDSITTWPYGKILYGSYAFFHFTTVIFYTLYVLYLPVDFIGCRFGKDETWSITWPATNIGGTAIQKCPGGSEVKGKKE